MQGALATTVIETIEETNGQDSKSNENTSTSTLEDAKVVETNMTPVLEEMKMDDVEIDKVSIECC